MAGKLDPKEVLENSRMALNAANNYADMAKSEQDVEKKSVYRLQAKEKAIESKK